MRTTPLSDIEMARLKRARNYSLASLAMAWCSVALSIAAVLITTLYPPA